MKFVKEFLGLCVIALLLCSTPTNSRAEQTTVQAVSIQVTKKVVDEHAAMKHFLAYIGNEHLPPPWLSKKDKENETKEQRAERIRMISDLTVEEAVVASGNLGWYWSAYDLALAAYIKMWHESGRFRLKVHNGKIRGDNGKSVCLGQIMNGGKSLIGTDRESTRRCIAAVMKHLVMHQRRCLTEVTEPSAWAMSKVFAGYGTGHSCKESAWMPIKDENGNPILDERGQPKRDYWARKRGYVWWRVRKLLTQGVTIED